MTIQVFDRWTVNPARWSPRGYRFHPTDEELVSDYLIPKAVNSNSEFQAIGEVDFNQCEPWDLAAMTKSKESTLYFFTHKDRKYPTGERTNRATTRGYWKATGRDRRVVNGKRLVAAKKTLVFHTGRAPNGQKTNWVMHEYRLEGDSFELTSNQKEWVVCSISQKRASSKPLGYVESDTTSYNTEYNFAHSSSSPPALQSLEPTSSNSTIFSTIWRSNLHTCSLGLSLIV